MLIIHWEPQIKYKQNYEEHYQLSFIVISLSQKKYICLCSLLHPCKDQNFVCKQNGLRHTSSLFLEKSRFVATRTYTQQIRVVSTFVYPVSYLNIFERNSRRKQSNLFIYNKLISPGEPLFFVNWCTNICGFRSNDSMFPFHLDPSDTTTRQNDTFSSYSISIQKSE